MKKKIHITFASHHSLIVWVLYALLQWATQSYNDLTAMLLGCTFSGHFTADPFLLPHIDSVRRCGLASKIRPVYHVLSSLRRFSDRNFAFFSFRPLRKKSNAFGVCTANSARQAICHIQVTLSSQRQDINNVVVTAWNAFIQRGCCMLFFRQNSFLYVAF